MLPYFANVSLVKISIRDVDAYRQHKLKEATRRRVAAAANRPKRDRRGQPLRPMSAASINKTIDVLQAVLELAHEYDLITSNPARGRRRRLKVTHPPAIYLDRLDHIQALLHAATDLDQSPRWRDRDRHAILATLMLAGLRVGELCHLHWSDIDLTHHRIHIHRSKTTAGRREITILPLLHRALTLHHARASHPVESDLVFRTQADTPRHPANLRNHTLAPTRHRADELLTAAGQPPLPTGLTPHHLRHTFASILVSRGDDPASVMAQLGHTDAHFTLRVYAHQMRRSRNERDLLKAYVDDNLNRPPAASPTSSTTSPIAWSPSGRSTTADALGSPRTTAFSGT